MEFKTWFEHADYGFERRYQQQKMQSVDEGDKPIPDHDVAYIISQLRKHGYGELEPKKDDFSSDVHWGTGFGSLSFTISPFGRFTGTIRRQSVDLHGKPINICEGVILLKDFENPDQIISHVDKLLTSIVRLEIPGPKKSYKELEKLSILVAKYINSRSNKRIFIYQGIKIVRPNKEYIIMYNCTGMGRQRQDQKRLDQFQINIREQNGLININGNELGDKITKHRWILDVSEFQEYFSPTQDKKDIADIIALYVKAY